MEMAQKLEQEAQLMAEAQVSPLLQPGMRAVKIREVKAEILAKWKANELPPESDELVGDTLWFVRQLQDLSAAPEGKAVEASCEDATQVAFQLAALQTVATSFGIEVSAQMQAFPKKALFALAAKLLYALLSFRGEANCSNALSFRAMNQAGESVAWAGMDPQALLSQWFTFPALLNVFGGAPLRASFEAAQRGRRAQFLCALLRVQALEVITGNMQMRAQWTSVLELFPEVRLVQALFESLKPYCWEDVRDRSKSRSRSRERRKRKKAETDSSTSSSAVRFFVKGTGILEDQHLGMYFRKFGSVTECAIVRDKKKGFSRGMAFVAIEPTGVYRGKKNTKEMVQDWVLEQKTHNCQGVMLEVQSADTKSSPEIDEKKKEQLREERMDERRALRERREQRAGTALTEELVPSPWAKKWRTELLTFLPTENDCPLSWADERLRTACSDLWNEAVEYIERIGGHDEGLALFRVEKVAESETPWAFVPAANLLLTVCEGIIGLTSGGVFASETKPEPHFPFALAVPSNPVAAQPQPQGGHQHFSANPSAKRLVKGSSEHEKIFVGGLTQNTSLDMLTAYFGQYGPLTDAVVMMDRNTGMPRGFGFVVFENTASVDKAVEDYSNHRIDGKWVEVKRATPQQDQQAVPAAQPQVIAPFTQVATPATVVRPRISRWDGDAARTGPVDVAPSWPAFPPSAFPPTFTPLALPPMDTNASGFFAGVGVPSGQPMQYDPLVGGQVSSESAQYDPLAAPELEQYDPLIGSQHYEPEQYDPLAGSQGPEPEQYDPFA